MSRSRPVALGPVAASAALLSAALALGAQGGAEDPIELYRAGVRQLEAKDYASALASLQRALERVPGAPGMTYQLARTLAALGRGREALDALDAVAGLGAAPKAEDDPAFRPLAKDARFEAVVARLAEKRRPLGRSTVAFTIPQKDLIAEGIAYDPVDDAFYVGSTYRCKIVRVDREGRATDFAADRQDGLWGVLGMEVDAGRRHLWAATANGDENENMSMLVPDRPNVGRTGLFLYDLATRRLLRKALLGGPGERHFFNDLVVARNGDVYATDTTHGAVYRLSAERDAPEALVPAATFAFPNGIALSSDERVLYVAHFAGIAVLELKSRDVRPLRAPAPSADSGAAGTALTGIDGLLLDGDSLIAVQGLAEVERIVRFRLGAEADRIESVTDLERNHPAFVLPTTGVVAKGAFHVIANSQLRSFDAAGRIFPAEKLQKTVVLRMSLDGDSPAR